MDAGPPHDTHLGLRRLRHSNLLRPGSHEKPAGMELEAQSRLLEPGPQSLLLDRGHSNRTPTILQSHELSPPR